MLTRYSPLQILQTYNHLFLSYHASEMLSHHKTITVELKAQIAVLHNTIDFRQFKHKLQNKVQRQLSFKELDKIFTKQINKIKYLSSLFKATGV